MPVLRSIALLPFLFLYPLTIVAVAPAAPAAYPEAAARVAAAAAGLSAFAGNTTRDLTAAAGDQVITGVGFQPAAMVCLGCFDQDGYVAGWSIHSSSTGKGIITYPTTQFADQAGLGFFVDGSNYQTFTGVSMDADGFTITWGKGGSPTGTGRLKYLCLA